MKVFKRDSNAVLFEKVKSLRNEPRNVWRCIYIEMSDRTERPEQIHFSGRIASELLINEEGYIFLCDDGDIFILFKGAVMPKLRKLSTYFNDFHPDHIADANHISVFDLGQNWQSFFDLCRLRAYDDTINIHVTPSQTPAAL